MMNSRGPWVTPPSCHSDLMTPTRIPMEWRAKRVAHTQRTTAIRYLCDVQVRSSRTRPYCFSGFTKCERMIANILNPLHNLDVERDAADISPQ
jgi:hypothetical protein